MSGCSILCQDVQFYVRMCIQFSLQGLFVFPSKYRFYPQMCIFYNSMSGCTILCLIVYTVLFARPLCFSFKIQILSSNGIFYNSMSGCAILCLNVYAVLFVSPLCFSFKIQILSSNVHLLQFYVRMFNSILGCLILC